MARTGVLLTAYGGPTDLEGIHDFMCSVMGVEPSDAVLAEARLKYLTIGGRSPLPAMAERIAAQLERVLNGMEPAEIDQDDTAMSIWAGGAASPARATGDIRIPVVVGMLHSQPSIDDAVQRLADAGVRVIVHVSLSPFDAASTTVAYRDAIDQALKARSGIRMVEAAAYHLSPGFVEMHGERLADALAEAATSFAGKSIVVFTAHSLPVEDVRDDPSYVDQLRETTAAVAAAAGLSSPGVFDALPGIDAFGGSTETTAWLLTYQSKGRRGGEWIGPSLDDVIDAAVGPDYRTIIVCPIGFAIDHMETLYDLDVVAADRVLSADREFTRVAAPNADSAMIGALADAVRKVL